MKLFRLFLLAGCTALTAVAQTPDPAPAVEKPAVATDAEVAARETALTLAGAFANNGFKVRDGYWSGTLEKGGKKAIEVNLYAGNEYWFSLGASAEASAVEVKVFNEEGAQVNTESYTEGMTAAAGFRPEASGPYYLQIGGTTGADATFCLVYSYK